MSTLGTAYVQIVPSAKGISTSISQSLAGPSAVAGTKAGGLFAGGMSKAFMKAGAIVAIGGALIKGISASINEGAKLEQSLGGIETMFGKHADKVIKNADRAYKSAGISANDYMQQATSFSASLLQSLDGDTKKAASSADMAIRDMADNANKFGSDIGSIQFAYQGFAKQNYTMLDNLKLGYGGTKTEMERLLKDAGKLSGKKYNISNLNDVYSAIHVVQKEMGVTGTTSKEAASTLSGSMASMKASATNFLGNLALGRNVNKSFKEMGSAVWTFVGKNLMPAVGRIILGLPGLIARIPGMIADGLSGNSKGVGAGVGKFVGKLLVALLKAAPRLLVGGVKLMFAIIKGILSGKAALGKGIIDALETPFKKAKAKVIGIVQKIKAGISKIIPKLKIRVPRLNLDGGKAPWGFGGKGKKPSISVRYNAKGGIFNKPTLLGGNNVVGEAGSEAVLPLKSLWKKFDEMTEAIAVGGSGGVIHVHVEVEGREIASAIAPHMKPALDRINTRTNRKLGYV